MAQTLYGASVVKSPNNPQNFANNVIGKNSEAFTIGDIVTIGTDGMYVNTGTDSVIGVVTETATMTSTNETVKKYCPQYVPIDQDMEFLMGTNYDMSALTSVGAYYKLTGGTGAQQVDVSSGAQTTTSRIVMCTKVDPFGLGGTGSGSGVRQGFFKIVKPFNVKTNT